MVYFNHNEPKEIDMAKSGKKSKPTMKKKGCSY